MKRDLIKQMKNEWRENIWLFLELLIVLVAVWALMSMMYMNLAPYFEQRGFSVDNVYRLSLKYVNPESPNYVDFPEEEKSARNGEDRMALLTRLRKSPYVEAAAFSSNGLPYQFSYMGSGLNLGKGDSLTFQVNRRRVSPDMVRILKYESLDGTTADEMISLLRKGEALLASYKDYDKYRDPRGLLGKPLYNVSDSTRRFISHVLITNIRRSDFENPWGGTLVTPIDDSRVAAGQDENVWEIVVRIKPGSESKFLEEFRNDRTMQIHRNVYLGQPQSLTRMRDTAQRTSLMTLRMIVGGSICLLVMVFLGLLGTFWYRIRRRESEIAIRKVNGATSGDIFRRLISEGLLLAALAMAVAVVIAVVFAKSGIMPEYDGFYRDLISGGVISLVIMLIVVVAGISIPARLAMRIEPAVALKDE